MSSQTELNGLRAQVIALRTGLEKALTLALPVTDNSVCTNVSKRLTDVLGKTPEQCVNDIKAQALEEMASNLIEFLEGGADGTYTEGLEESINRLLSKIEGLRK